MTALTQRRLVVIPMKDPSRAKTRLGAALDANGRAGIALALFQATLNHLSEALMLLPHGSVDIAVLTSSPEISRIAQRAGVALIDDEGHDGLSQSLEVAAAWGARQGYDAICILPGDLAAPKACDLARLLSHDLAQGRAVFCPSADLGTNALLAPLPCPFRFQYGPNSVVHHRRAAERAGLWPVILPLESLRIDVDTVEDLGHLLARNPQILAQEGHLMSLSVTLTALPGVPDIQDGDNLSAIFADCLSKADLPLRDGDILCVAQKVFSKAEGCIIPLASVTPSPEALRYGEELNKDPRKVEVVLRESTRVVRSFKRPDQNEGTMICEHRLGFISANAAVDQSNFGEEDAAMVLPKDPDASCARLQRDLAEHFDARIGVVMTDTFGRPWRLGQVNVAIGLSKVPATICEQGNLDAWGRPLEVTEPAFADEIAAATGLVVRKNGRTPAVLLRGLDWQPADSRGADILRKKQEDMFR